jgi:hypothetical protein
MFCFQDVRAIRSAIHNSTGVGEKFNGRFFRMTKKKTGLALASPAAFFVSSASQQT